MMKINHINSNVNVILVDKNNIQTGIAEKEYAHRNSRKMQKIAARADRIINVLDGKL